MAVYCTNCGAKSSKKICENCGVRKNRTHNFCAFCGEKLSEKASICTNCKEPVKVESPIWNILNLIFAVLILGMFVLTLYADEPMISFLLSALCCFPFTKEFIRKATTGKIGLRNVLNISRIVVAILFLYIGLYVELPKEHAVYDVYNVYEEQATAAAEVVFHEEVQLKNEASYVLNDSKVIYDEATPYKGIEGSPNRLVWVTLDYSAQNGFGGLNRETYVVEMIFNITNGRYYRISDRSLIRY